MSNLATRVDNLVGGDVVWHRVVRPPRFDQCVGELPARFDQEGPGAHRRVADLEVEDPFGPGRTSFLVNGFPLPIQHRGLLNP